MIPLARNGFRLFPIHPDGSAAPFGPPWPDDLSPIIEMTKTFYAETGYLPPWIAYLATWNGTAVGGGAFVGSPADGVVEIAYFTRPAWQGQGCATCTAEALVAIARRCNPEMAIQAKTQALPNPSARILQGLGFFLIGLVQDHEIGEAWLWILNA